MDAASVATAELDGLDPHEALAREAERIDAYFSTAPDDVWDRPSRCTDWSVRDVLAHLAATEAYHEACLEGTVGTFLEACGAKGATDMDSFNAIGIAELADLEPGEVLDLWRERNTAHRAELRARGAGMVDSSVGEYPALWQAWHLASELATHADDAFVPETADESEARRGWRARFSRFALAEAKPELTIITTPTGTTVEADGLSVSVDDATLIEAAMGREAGLGDDARRLLTA